MGFGEQDAVGHHLDEGSVIGTIIEANLVAHRVGTALLQFHRQPCCQRPRGNSPRLGTADHAVYATPQFQTDFRQLCGLAGAGFAAENDDLMLLNQVRNLMPALGNRQGIVEFGMGNHRMALLTRLETLTRLRQ